MLVLRKSFLLKRLKKRVIEFSSATIKVSASANNVIVCCVDCSGNVVAWTSAGERGFKGAKKASPFAAQITMETILKKVARLGVKVVDVEVSGNSSNREVILRALQAANVTVAVIREVTPAVHNGCRPPKARRT
ncbi:MAG: 30S ribosomal protein S11 [Candidatus Hodgkinia cicadicola]